MMEETNRVREEEAAIHRTRCAVSEVLHGLKALGLYEMMPAGPGKFKPARLDRAQRRDLLVFLSELEEHVKALEAFKNDLARDIEAADRHMNAASAYRQTGLSLKKSARQRH